MSLLPDSQKQNVGDNSTAIQAQGNISLSYGIGYRDVKDICSDLFTANFPKLKEEAIAEARAHVQLYAESLMESLKTENPELLSVRLSSPDVQFAINESVMQVAKLSSKEKSELLKELIVGKIKTTDEETNILLNEAIELLPKLSKNQLSFLTGFWVIRNKILPQTPDALLAFMLDQIKNNAPRDANGAIPNEDALIKLLQDVAIPNIIAQTDAFFKDKGRRGMSDLANAIEKPVNLNELERRGFLLSSKFYNAKTSKMFTDKIGIDEGKLTMDKLELEFPVIYDFLIRSGVKDLSSLDSVTLSDISNTIAEIHWKALLEVQ